MTVRVRVLKVPYLFGEGVGPGDGGALPMNVRVRVLVMKVPYL